MAFNPNSNVPALVAAFSDARLSVFNYLTGELQWTSDAVRAWALSCSPDGQYVVLDSWDGDIRVFKFEQTCQDGGIGLCPIYLARHYNAAGQWPETSLWAETSLVVSADGQRVVQVCGSQARVSQPAALSQTFRAGRLEMSTGPSKAPGPLIWPPSEGLRWNFFIPLVPSTDKSFLVAGTLDHRVVKVSAHDPSKVCSLFLPDAPALPREAKHVPTVRQLQEPTITGRQILMLWTRNFHRLVACAIDPDAIRAEYPADLPTTGGTLVADQCFDGDIAYLLVSPSGDRVLVRGEECWDRLCTVPSGAVYLPGGELEKPRKSAQLAAFVPKPRSIDARRRTPKSAFHHPGNSNWFVIITESVARIYSWADFTELTRPEGLQLARTAHHPVQLWAPEASYHIGPGFVIEHCPGRLYVWPASELDPASPTGVVRPATNPNLTAVTPTIETILCVTEPSTVVFLDIKFWVCTVELQSITPDLSITAVPRDARVMIQQSSFRTTPAASNGSASSTNCTPFHSLERPIQPTVPTRPEAAPAAQARRHFFLLSEWQGDFLRLQCSVLAPPPGPYGSGEANWRDAAVAVADKDQVVVIEGGFHFEESVVVSQTDMLGGGRAGESVWKVVEGMASW